MSQLIRSSLTWKLLTAMVLWYRGTALARAGERFRGCWRSSAVYGLFARLLTGEPAVERSRAYGLFQWANDRLHSPRYTQKVNASLFRSLWNRLMEQLRSSLILGKLFSGGMTTFLLCLIAAYWPVDYLLRDVLQLAGISSVWDEAMMALGFLLVLHQRITAENPIQSRLNAVDLALGFYLLAGLLLLLYTATVVSVNITGFRASMQYILIFYLVVRLIRDEKDFRLMYDIMVLFATIFALHAIYQYIVGVPIPEHWTDQAEGAVRTRAFSVFSNPNILAAYMILFAPMTIGGAYETDDPKKKLLFWACGLCMCLATLFTMSRGAWLALAVGAVLFALIVDRRLFLAMAAAGIAACFLPFVRSRISYLFTQDFAVSNAKGGRGKRWATALGYVEQQKAWAGGLGYGIFGGAVSMQNQINPAYEYMYVDNYYVKILTENGVIGLVSYLLSMVAVLWSGFRSCALAEKKKKPLCAGMLAGLVAILVQSFFESIWEEPYMMALFFAVAGMMVYLGFFAKGSREKQHDM